MHRSSRVILAFLCSFSLILPSVADAAVYGYIANFSGNTVSVVDLADDAVIATFTASGGPVGIAISGTGAYLSNNGNGTVSLIDITTVTLEKTISVNFGLQHIVVSGTGVYVSSTQTNGVSVIDTTTNTVEREISVNTPGRMVASGTGVYVAQDGFDTIAIIDTTTQTVERTIGVGNSPRDVIVSGTGVYVTNFLDNTVSMIDTTSGTVEKTISVGTRPYGLATSGTGVYVTNSSSDNVSVIDTNTDSVTKTITVGNNPISAAMYDGKVYVLNFDDDTVTVIDAATNVVLDTFAAGNGPYDMAFGPDLAEPEVSFETDLSSASETAGSTTVNVSLSGSTFLDVSVPFTVSGTATEGVDYTLSTPSPVILNAGETSTGIVLTILNDDIIEGTKTIILTMDSPTNAGTGETLTHIVTLISEDVEASSSSSLDVGEGRGGGSREVTMAMKIQAAQQRFGTLLKPAVEIGGTSSSSAPSYFKDVPSSAWFHTAVETLRLRNVVSGYKNANGTDSHLFGPSDSVTYGQLAKMIGLLTNHKPSNMESTMHWAEPYVREARENNFSVFADTSLNLDSFATRAAVVRTILEVYGISLDALPQDTFLDLPTNHPYAKDILTATVLNIIRGDEGGRTMRPDALINRAEAAKILADVSARFTPIRKSASSSHASSTSSSASSVASPLSMASQAAMGADMRTVSTPTLNVRSDARINATLLWTAKQGMQMEVLRIIANDWAHIRVSDGNEGYVWVHHLR